MKSPLNPKNEAQRLNALIELELLDSQPEERFDRITRLAQKMFKVEIALVSLVDKERQWFKSKQGLDACETGRDISFCGHAILQDELFIIDNAINDKRFFDNPLVTGGPNIRFYAGAPLKSPDGFAIGTLCIIDSSPKNLNESEKQSLSDLAALVEQEIAQIKLRYRYDQLNLYSSIAALSSELQAQYLKTSDIHAAKQHMLGQLIRLSGSKAGLVAFTSKHSDSLLLSHIAAIQDSDALDIHQRPDITLEPSSVLFTPINHGSATIVNDAVSEDSALQSLFSDIMVESLLVVPIMVVSDIIGVMIFINRDKGFKSWQLEWLVSAGQSLSQLIEADKQIRYHQDALVAQAQHTQSILDNMHEGVVTVDKHGVIRSVNPSITRIFGYNVNELIGLPFEKLAPYQTNAKTGSDSHLYTKKGLTKLTGSSLELEGLRNDGAHFPIEITFSSVTHHEESLVIGLIRDITERKRVEQAKSEFLSTVNHELRTPLTSISGALTLVNSGALGALPDKSKNMLTIAQRNCERLGFLINDLLDMEKLIAGKMQFDRKIEALAQLIETSVESNLTYAIQRNVAIDITETIDNAKLYVDSQRFMQIMSNLLSNAIKYSPDGKSVEVCVTRHNGIARIAVKDFGSGIPDEFKNKVFEKFSQADSSDTRKVGGTGLGLAITRELVQRMGGTIGFESEVGKGSCFYFDMPLVDGVFEHPEEFTGQVGTGGKILVVEDEHDVAQVLSSMLIRAGFEVEVAVTAAQAEQAVKREKFDAITLDIMLPDKSGLEVLKLIKSEPRISRTPVLVVSAKVDNGNLMLQTNVKDVEWMAKPFHQNDLVSTLNNLIARSNHGRAIGLHIEDDIDMYQLVQQMGAPFFDLDHAGDINTSRDLLQQRKYDFVLLDDKLPDGSGWDLVDEIQEQYPDTKIIVFTGFDLGLQDSKKVEAVLLKKSATPAELLEVIISKVG